ncbi:hypothetical protein HXX76_011434 [Chlamydomonas incerta]|uniref:BACK domain-containing protein n=1 Tax=Chlamydomonas incerta TaxID=51695 RepID=A0A835SN93_CHLIN|nr:hypothetical protein HXX76_011434 [Chlamydomonas incerta]|eukprot:KAG2428731.1 hypothetical protein HXX76_011434 [Chlamydomonas incerta]
MSPVAPGNPDVVTYLAGLYGQQEYSDCKVVFMLEKAPPPGGQVAPSTTSLAPGSVVGAPLPAHSCILRPACDKWNQQWLDWTPRPDSDAHASKRRKLSADQAVTVTITVAGEASPSGAARADVPEICVALRSADEMVAAAAVVKFAYTGLVEAGSITEALQVRRQADYLRMPRCMEACLALVKEGPLLAEGPSAGASASATGGGDGDGGGNSSNAQAAIELLGCGALWPDPANDPTWRAFGALLAEATRQLVAHFGDALAVLNNDDLLNQMRALPVMCLALLLESDDFGTDDESSVVLVLAMWMGVNYSRTSAKARRQLCGMLRLVHCSRAYLDWVLPALALDHHCHPNSGAGWLPIVPSQVGWLSKYVGASGPMKKALWEERRAGGRWRAGGLAQRQAAAPAHASVSLATRVPAAYAVKSGTVHQLNQLSRPAESLRVDVYLSKSDAGGQRTDALIGSFASSEVVVTYGFGLRRDVALSGAAAPPPAPEQQPAHADKTQEQQARRAREAAVAAQWAAYLRDGN